jgi:multiple sugar transport system substrate-binding protein
MTWDEFIPLAQKLTIRAADGHVIQYGFSFDYMQWKEFLPQWGAHVYSADGTRCVLDSPEAIASMQLQWDLIFKYKVMPTAAEEDGASQAGGWGSNTMKFLGDGGVATALGGRWWLCTMRNYSHLNLGVCESPHGPLRQFSTYGKATCINKKSPNREKALKFLMYMATKPYSDLVNQEADGLAPVMKYCYPDANLINPKFPNEDFHPVFRDQTARGVSEEVSPFCNTAVAEQIFKSQVDLIRGNAKSPAEGMKEMARQVNAEIAKTLARDPEMKAQYDALIAKESPGNLKGIH